MKNHVIEKLSAYLNQELPPGERHRVAEHLLGCPKCREEHERIKFGVTVASNLRRADAPENTWNEIKNSWEQKESAPASPPPTAAGQFSFFNSFASSVTVAPLFIVFALAAIAYMSFFGSDDRETVRNDQGAAAAVNEKTNTPAAVTAATSEAVRKPNEIPVDSAGGVPANTAAIDIEPTQKQQAAGDIPSWQVVTIAGAPTAKGQAISRNGTLAVGDFLETDANSRARISVANIGQVEIAPNSRVQLVRTQSTEHRMSLERGVLQARILAPPRLFIVDTPSAVAVDLGCEYKLEVDKNGNSRLHVTSGFVALERDGRESIVPAGATCLTRHGKGIGTPFFEDASPAFQSALNKFDFAPDGNSGAALQIILKESRSYDTLTLWHLLTRVSPGEREQVFDRLASFVKTPAGVTREGVLSLDKKMLERWREEIENLWFE